MMNIEVNSSFFGSMFLVQYSSHSHIDSSLIQNVPDEPAEQHKTDREKKRTEVHAGMRKNVLKKPGVKWLLVRSDTNEPEQDRSQF